MRCSARRHLTRKAAQAILPASPPPSVVLADLLPLHPDYSAATSGAGHVGTELRRTSRVADAMCHHAASALCDCRVRRNAMDRIVAALHFIDDRRERAQREPLPRLTIMTFSERACAPD
jgi:hypothetical protein